MQAHRRGLVHRDVKPANVLLDPNEHAYLSDFGISTQMGGAAADGGHTGTLDYLAPEQIRGEAVDARSDCYALTCILYECLAGEPPFRRQTEAETLWAHLQSEPAPLSSYPALEPVFRKGLAKEKDERYESCGAMIEAAAAALGLDTPAALRRRPISPALVRRRRAITVAGAAVLAGAIAAAVIAVTGGGDPDRQPPGNTLVSIDAATGKFIEQVPVGATPTDVAVGGGAAWSFSGDEKTVSRVDISSGEVRTLSAGPHPIEIAAGGDSLWAAQASGQDAKFASIDAATSPAALTRFDAVSGAERGTTPLPVPAMLSFNIPPGNLLAVGSGAVWALGRPGWVYRLDERGGRLLTRRSLQAWGIATGDGQVWIRDRNNEVVRLDPRTGRPTRRVSLPKAEWVTSNRRRRRRRVADGQVPGQGLACRGGASPAAQHRPRARRRQHRGGRRRGMGRQQQAWDRHADRPGFQPDNRPSRGRRLAACTGRRRRQAVDRRRRHGGSRAGGRFARGR